MSPFSHTGRTFDRRLNLPNGRFADADAADADAADADDPTQRYRIQNKAKDLLVKSFSCCKK